MTAMQLRGFQTDALAGVNDAWSSGTRVVGLVSPTGSGKTVMFSDVLRRHVGASVAIAHRQELVSQISIALARNEVPHRIIAPKNVIRTIVNLQIEETGRSFYTPSAQCAVAGVDTLLHRDDLRAWAQSVTLWVTDECHHLLTDNKWGKAAQLFTNARGLGVTATPCRADGKGLGSHADGLIDHLVTGPSMRELINDAFLTEYRIFAPPSDVDLSSVTITGSGDYSQVKLKKAVRQSHIIGDVVTHYLRIASGKLGVTFATDVETGADITAQFNAAGVPAAMVTAKTPDAVRVHTLQRFRRRELLQLVNVDLFGEGFDLPAIEVVSMARPTQSYGLYVQQFGRALRPVYTPGMPLDTVDQRRAAMSSKPAGIIIDHVGNVMRHGLPDAPREWTLDRRDKRARSGPDDVVPLRICTECAAAYNRVLKVCPVCGHTWAPTDRSRPEFVDGDLSELTPEMLAQLRGEVARVDMPVDQYRNWQRDCGVPPAGVIRNERNHAGRQEAQRILRERIAWWAGWQKSQGLVDDQIYRQFYVDYGVDMLSACALGTAEADGLTRKINESLPMGYQMECST